MLVVHRDFEINNGALNSSDVIKYIYNLEVVDYKDPVSGNPIVYDVYIQQQEIKVIRPYNVFTTTSEITTVLTVNRIESNVFSTLQNNGAYLSFKTCPDEILIQVKFVTFAQVLSAFGSFYTTMNLAGLFVAAFFTETILRSRLINALFTFISNDPKEVDRLEIDIRQLKKNNNVKHNELEVARIQIIKKQIKKILMRKEAI